MNAGIDGWEMIMKKVLRTTTIVVVTAGMVVLGGGPVLAQSGHDLFQQALVKERAEGDLRGAIDLYERVAREFASDRALAASALVQVGRCYEKLGSTEAESAYQRVVRDFADQGDMVAQARTRLAMMQRAARAAEAVTITTRRVHIDPLGRAEPYAPTPDGRHLLYADWSVGELAVRDLASGESRFLTQDASWSEPTEYVWGASASPDGRTVSYLWADEDAGSLRLVGIDGSDPRVLLRGGFREGGDYQEDGCWVGGHVWTSDSQHIVGVGGCGAGPVVQVLSVVDGSARLVKELGPDALHEGLSLSPDDRYVAFGVDVERDGGNYDIRLLALDGSSDVPLIQHPANDRLLGWVPGTGDILFLSDRDGTIDAWALRVVDGAATGPPRLVRRNMGHVDPLGFTKDGTLFYSTYTRWFSTSVAAFDVATATIDVESSVAILGSNMSPATWSPDGESLAFIQEQEGPGGPGGPYKRPLHVRHLATGVERELAVHLQGRRPRWSPDGRFILMNGWEEAEGDDDHGGLYLAEVESGQVTRVLEVPEGTVWWYGIGAEWTRDGESILYSQYDKNLREGRLVRRELESGRERELYRDSLLTTRLLAVSPDGERLVFGVRSSMDGNESTISGGGRLMIMDLQSGGVRELCAIGGPGRLGSLQWTPDGEQVLFAMRDAEDRSTSVWHVPSDGGDPEELWPFEEAHFGHFGADFRLSPDGRKIAYTTYHQEFEAWAMENLREVLEEGR
jgi:Tol biopolymer transport system component